jgi:hypothetical protein
MVKIVLTLGRHTFRGVDRRPSPGIGNNKED